MYSRWQLILKYLRYYFSAMNGRGHGMHSPFVFDFIKRVLNDSTQYPAYNKIEELRRKLIQDRQEIVVEDLGAGSRTDAEKKRRISSIARTALKPKKYGQLLYRIARYYQPKVILELGTSLGITTSYLAMARPEARTITMEGASSIASIAQQNFEQINVKPELRKGNFDQTLSPILKELGVVDLAFIDGNHRQEPTQRYFQEINEKANNDTIIIIDDIHWSNEMEAAWETIKNDEKVRCSLDLFFIGIAFFREEFHEKQHFTIRF